MDKNLIIAVSLSILVYVGWFSFLEKRYPTPPAHNAVISKNIASSLAPAVTGNTSNGGQEGALDFQHGPLLFKIQPLGASIVGFRYPGPLGSVELVSSDKSDFFSTWPTLKFSPAKGTSNPVFEARHPTGAILRKEYTFKNPDEVQNLRLTLTNPKNTPITINDLDLSAGPGLGTVASEQKENARLWSAVALLYPEEGRTQDRLFKVKLKDPDQIRQDKWKWLGLNNRYFLAAMFPPSDVFSGFETGATRDEAGVLSPWIKARASSVLIPAKGVVTIDIPFYLGPKGYTHLRKFAMGLERSVEFGYFNQLGRYTLRVLLYLHGLTRNWGWAIIFFTLLLQLLLSPLTYKSLKSAAAMKKVQPEMAKLQQKYAKDPQRLNMEMMGLYKKHGANPLGGCLPMVAQMPLFIALFNTLRNAWELHGAPWIFWIKDLSAQDPYYILPLIMGGIMFTQNKLNPAPTADPAQAQMMTFMPIIFTVMFLKFPAGLVLYWTTNSIFSFTQQMVFKNRLS